MLAWLRRQMTPTLTPPVDPNGAAKELIDAIITEHLDGVRERTATPDPVPPLIAAMAKTPDRYGCVEVMPPGVQEHAVGFTLKTSKLDPTDVAGFCRDNPIFHPTDLDPPADLSFADKAAYIAVLKGMKDWDRALLYEKGGMLLIRETVLLAMKKLAANHETKSCESKPA